MTHHKITVQADGTRRYSNGTKYKPMKAEDRTHQVRKPDVEGALRFHGDWFLPLPLLPDGDRAEIPETRNDEQAYEHTLYCGCVICARPSVDAVKWRRWKKPPRS